VIGANPSIFPLARRCVSEAWKTWWSLRLVPRRRADDRRICDNLNTAMNLDSSAMGTRHWSVQSGPLVHSESPVSYFSRDDRSGIRSSSQTEVSANGHTNTQWGAIQTRISLTSRGAGGIVRLSQVPDRKPRNCESQLCVQSRFPLNGRTWEVDVQGNEPHSNDRKPKGGAKPETDTVS
jgi:hypothetical protein